MKSASPSPTLLSMRRRCSGLVGRFVQSIPTVEFHTLHPLLGDSGRGMADAGQRLGFTRGKQAVWTQGIALTAGLIDGHLASDLGGAHMKELTRKRIGLVMVGPIRLDKVCDQPLLVGANGSQFTATG